MKKLYNPFWPLLFLCLLLQVTSRAQSEAAQGEVFFNYGSVSGGISQYYYSSFTIGQPVVGPYFGSDYQGALGFWSRFLVSPAPPIVNASEGDFPDRVLLDWAVDPLSPASDQGFKIYRDGAFLASVDPATLQFIDFNVIPGNFYNYQVRGVNTFGDGYLGAAVGFVNPNGSVTGQVTTINDNPVAGVQVTLEPTIGNSLAFNGVDELVTIPYNSGFTDSLITVSCWVKNVGTSDGDAVVDLGQDTNSNWWINATATGLEIGIGNSTFPVALTTDPTEWHHIAFTFNYFDLNVYLDGTLMGTLPATMNKAERSMYLGGNPNTGTDYFGGQLDDLRVYNRQLSQTEIISTMNATVPSTAPGLVAYWKFDEGTGYKIFDLSENQLDGYMTGVTFSNDRPNVLNAGVTDESGYYLIDGINYGGGQSFVARPSKNFEFNNALEFNASNNQYATMTGFSPTDSTNAGAIEVWFKPSVLTGAHTILSNGSIFDLTMNGTDLMLTFNGTSQNIGTVNTTDYVHVTINYSPSSSPNISTFIDGEAAVSFIASIPTDWESNSWNIGRNSADSDYFAGLIDEVVFFKSIRSYFEIQNDVVGIDVTDLALQAYFSLNESVGTTFADQSPNNTGTGAISNGASWTSITANPETVPHEFTPSSRIVTLDPSNTGTDNVDFTDISTVGVSGYVRYAGTQCFAENTEILVNGLSNVPPIYTDADGKFAADFEPGTSFILSPKMDGHSFIPAFWEITNIVVPKAGIVFNNQTTRDVDVLLAGGLCEKSIVGETDSVVVKLESRTNDCFEEYFVLPANTKKLKFKNVPPIEYTVKVVHHSVPDINSYFVGNSAVVGGINVDLLDADTSLNFIYRSRPEIETTPFDTLCMALGYPLLEQFEKYQTNIKVYEPYNGQRCYLDTVLLTVDNVVSGGGASVVDTAYSGGTYKHKFNVGEPEIAAPYTKRITITAKDPYAPDAATRTATTTMKAIVTGKRKRASQFATTSPEIPWMILRDPPGDNSFSYWENGDQLCYHTTNAIQEDDSHEGRTTVSTGAAFSVGGLFYSTPTSISANASAGFVASKTQTNEYETKVCLTATTRISTDDGDVVVGGEMGGDVYVGGALNLIFGIADILEFDTANCQLNTDTTLVVAEDGFATQYMYSEYHVKNSIMPGLAILNDTASIAMWQQILDRNANLKEEAFFSENLSFDAGIKYEYSKMTETENTVTYDWQTTLEADFAVEAGINVGGSGINSQYTYAMSTTIGGSESSSEITTNTVGYELKDDDTGDNFTVDILEDRVYGVPVFNISAGQSSCPHEPGTQNRDEVSFTVEESVRTNIPETEAATYQFNLGNVSPSGELRTYSLGVHHESNPDGAIIKVNGQAVNGLEYDVPFGESIPITLTVEKGETAYNYENLEITFSAACEDDRAQALGIDPDSTFKKVIPITAYFIESCSDVEISSPQENWVVTPSSNNQIQITVGSYDIDDTDLETVTVQYRPVDGDGIWINIEEIPKASLGPVYTVSTWDVTALPDGPFEIRAITACLGGLPAGISTVMPGKLERDPPELLGLPQPSDGILGLADQIYIEFSEEVDCSNLTSLPGALEDFVGLKNTQSDTYIDIEITCSGSRIYLTPIIQNTHIENKVLRAEVRGIKDLAGNPIPEEITWEFYVDRNPLNWVEGDISEVKYENESWSITRTIQNVGGSTEIFNLENTPAWISPSATTGEIAPGASKIIVFTVADDIASGRYIDTLQLANAMGDEPLGLDLAVLCTPPIWEVNPADFEYNMNFTLELDIEGELSEDEFDLVAAFVDGNLSGLGQVEYFPAPIDKYLVFLTVFNNDPVSGDVTFQIWDASACLLYGSVLETYTFVNGASYGTPQNTDVLHTQNIVLREIPVTAGWNWISFNLDMPDGDPNVVLESLAVPEGASIKTSNLFSQYSSNSQEWQGTLGLLGDMTYTTMYKFQGTTNDTITLLGHPIDPDTVDIPIHVGWNWIGYIPQQGASLNDALSSLTPLNGDIIKGRSTFAQYVAGTGWIGSLNYMEAPHGYLLKASQSGILNQFAGDETEFRLAKEKDNLMATTRSSIWNMNPADFEHSMTMVAFVEDDTLSLLKEGDQVAAFVNDEVRGVGTPIYIESKDKYMLFMTIHANEEGEDITYKYYDGATTEIFDLNETSVFEINASIGMVDSPESLTLATTSSSSEITSVFELSVQPNPFTESTNIVFTLPTADLITITVTDVIGNLVRKQQLDLSAGAHSFELQASAGISGAMLDKGMYVVTLKGKEGQVSEKVLLVR